MLKLKYLYENFHLARAALENWPHDAESLEGLLSQFRISNNAIYPFCQAGALCFLRLTPVEERQEKNVFGELEFVDYLNDHAYPALRYLPSASGEKLLSLPTPWGSYYAAAFQAVPGTPLDQTALTTDVMMSYGQALGQLHALASEYHPKTPKWSHKDVLDWIDRVLAKYGAPKGIAVFSRDLREKLAQLPQTSANYGLIHYDFECDNVFYDPSKAACWVIDFDDGMYHWYAMDIEIVLSALEADRGELGLAGHLLEDAKSAFIRGYREKYVYTEEMEQSRPLLRQFADLHTYAKLIRCVADKEPNEPDWMVQLRKKLDTVIAQKRNVIISERNNRKR